MKKANKFILLGVSGILATTMTACSKEYEEATQNLNSEVLRELNSDARLEQVINYDDFIFYGSDIRPSSLGYDVDISGKATSGESSGFVNLHYEIDGAIFDGVDAKNEVEVVSALCKIVQDYEAKRIEFVPVSNIDLYCKAMSSASESPIKNYDPSSAYMYSIYDLKFNENEGQFSFKTKGKMTYSTTVMEPRLIVTAGPNGTTITTTIMTPVTYYESFFQDYEIFIKATPSEIREMKLDPSKAIDKFISVVKNKEKTEYSVRGDNVQENKQFDDGRPY